MPDKCSVPGCTSNYRYVGVSDYPNAPVFKLSTGPPERVVVYTHGYERFIVKIFLMSRIFPFV